MPGISFTRPDVDLFHCKLMHEVSPDAKDRPRYIIYTFIKQPIHWPYTLLTKGEWNYKLQFALTCSFSQQFSLKLYARWCVMPKYLSCKKFHLVRQLRQSPVATQHWAVRTLSEKEQLLDPIVTAFSHSFACFVPISPHHKNDFTNHRCWNRSEVRWGQPCNFNTTGCSKVKPGIHFQLAGVKQSCVSEALGTFSTGLMLFWRYDEISKPTLIKRLLYYWGFFFS